MFCSYGACGMSYEQTSTHKGYIWIVAVSPAEPGEGSLSQPCVMWRSSLSDSVACSMGWRELSYVMTGNTLSYTWGVSWARQDAGLFGQAVLGSGRSVRAWVARISGRRSLRLYLVTKHETPLVSPPLQRNGVRHTRHELAQPSQYSCYGYSARTGLECPCSFYTSRS